MNKLYRNTWAEIDLNKLAVNINRLQEYIGKNVRISPVIKANAYGHGAVGLAKELVKFDIEYLAVATLTEALELRQNDINAQILVMGYTDNELLPVAVENDIMPTIFEYEQAAIISKVASSLSKKIKIHIKVDTGLNRLGKKPSDEYAEEIFKINKLPFIEIESIFSHLRLVNFDIDWGQFNSFTSFVNKLKSTNINIKYAHISDSIAAIKYKEFSLDMVRPGAIIYGYTPPYNKDKITVEPIMTLKTKITRIAKLKKGEAVGYSENFFGGDNTVIATLGAGFADGYKRSLSNTGVVTIRGKKAKIIGIICMDQMMADISDIPEAKVGDEVVLFGSNPGETSVYELADILNTNRNDVISAVTRRVPRVYIKDGKIVRIIDNLLKN